MKEGTKVIVDWSFEEPNLEHPRSRWGNKGIVTKNEKLPDSLTDGWVYIVIEDIRDHCKGEKRYSLIEKSNVGVDIQYYREKRLKKILG